MKKILTQKDHIYKRTAAIIGILRKELSNTALTKDESLLLKAWLTTNKKNKLLYQELTKKQGQEEALELFFSFDPERHLQHVLSNKHKEDTLVHENFGSIIKRIFSHQWIRYAAVILILLSVGTVIYMNHQQDFNQHTPIILAGDVEPGTNKASIVLADGSRIILDSTYQGLIIKDRITYMDGAPVEELQQTNIEAHRELILEVPRGGTYQITLSDGTKVWLNSGSKLKYPMIFHEKTRSVQLEGEAYFEVAKSYHQSGESRLRTPFYVHTERQNIEVLGTHFNVSDYKEDATSVTTLVEGKVKVSNSTGSHVDLYPGQQSKVNLRGEMYSQVVNPELFTSWKEGYFIFQDTPITEVMNTIARWYDIDVQYQGMLSKEKFNGTLSRQKRLSSILSSIEETEGVHFKIQGRRVIVMP